MSPSDDAYEARDLSRFAELCWSSAARSARASSRISSA